MGRISPGFIALVAVGVFLALSTSAASVGLHTTDHSDRLHRPHLVRASDHGTNIPTTRYGQPVKSSTATDDDNVDCGNFNSENGCSGQQTDQPAGWANRRFQTPDRSATGYQPTFQDYNRLVGYASISYNSQHTAATVTVHATAVDPSSTQLTYVFGSGSSAVTTAQNVFAVSAATLPTDTLPIAVLGSDGSKLVLEPLNFLWQATPVNSPPQYRNGQRGAIVELFGWPYADIEAECPTIGRMGWMGVKVYPPQESIFSNRWLQDNGQLNPWYFMYQPVSYLLHSRWGTRDQLRSMIQACRAAGVRVYADAVVNHMTGGGNDIQDHRNGNGGSCTYWGGKSSDAGSPYFTEDFNYENNTYTKDHPGLEYPAVPYGPLDFHCERPLNSWADPFDLNYGWLVGLSDLNSERPYVQQRIADYFTDLLSIGFSGLRIDAAKHFAPSNHAAIYAKLKANLGGVIPPDFITYLEVLIGGEKDLLMCQDGSYNYANSFNSAMKSAGLSDDDIAKIKIWDSTYPKEFPVCGYWVLPSQRFAIENDCHDDQFGGSSRDMGDKGSVLVREKNVDRHRGFETLLFSRTDGDWDIRLVLSSYTLMNNGGMGPPDGFSDCKNCVGPDCGRCLTVPYSKAYDPDACGYTVYDASGNWAQGVYTRVHRDRAIIMAMRQWLGLPTNVSNADIGLPTHCS